MIDPSFPVYASNAVFVLLGICALLIKEVNSNASEESKRVRTVGLLPLYINRVFLVVAVPWCRPRKSTV